MKDIVSGTSYSVYIYDSAGYTVKSSGGIRSGSSFNVKLEAGKRYDIQICQQTGFGSYLLEIE